MSIVHTASLLVSLKRPPSAPAKCFTQSAKTVVLICVLVENVVVLTNLTYVFFTSWLQRGHLRHRGFCFRFCGSVSFDRLLTWLSSALYLKLLFLIIVNALKFGLFPCCTPPTLRIFFFMFLIWSSFIWAWAFIPLDPKSHDFSSFFFTPLLVFILIFFLFLFCFSPFL